MCKEIFELRKKQNYMMADKKWNVRYTMIFSGEFLDEKSMPESAKNNEICLRRFDILPIK